MPWPTEGNWRSSAAAISAKNLRALAAMVMTLVALILQIKPFVSKLPGFFKNPVGNTQQSSGIKIRPNDFIKGTPDRWIPKMAINKLNCIDLLHELNLTLKIFKHQ